jgi:DNA-directed RNA polymerase specialized sigma24 family protein
MPRSFLKPKTLRSNKRRFNSYVSITIVNTLRTHLKTLLNNGIPLEQMPEQTDEEGNTEPVEFAAPSDNPDERIALRQITKGMRPEHKRVFRLIIEGYTYDEIAAMFSRSKQWVRCIVETNRLRAGRRKLATSN